MLRAAVDKWQWLVYRSSSGHMPLQT